MVLRYNTAVRLSLKASFHIHNSLLSLIFPLVILSRDCVSSLVGLGERRTKTLKIDDLEGGAIIYSHDFDAHSQRNLSSSLTSSAQRFYAQYPTAFSCEVVVHAPIENGRIMLTINSLFIPSGDQTCKDNFLYVFDSNTARSKAMVNNRIFTYCVIIYACLCLVNTQELVC